MQIQDTYLEKLRMEQTSVSLYLINGIKLLGQVSAYDGEVILLRDNKNLCEQLIYKHAISTIVPNRAQTQGSDFE
ncbi:MAG: chaperone Hfq [Burkholderiales bacterium]|jgi:host factor-I protein|nr:chaperone Hfq [Burkholderiales bacterium]